MPPPQMLLPLLLPLLLFCAHADALSVKATQSKYAERLSRMMRAVSVPESTIALVPSASERTLLRGVSAALDDDKVVDAFTILYEDIAPVRLAGDLIFRTLESRVEAARNGKAKLVETAAYTDTELLAARKLFDLVDRDGSGGIDRQKLLDSGLLRSVGHCDGCACDSVRNCVKIDDLMVEIDSDGDDRISFEEFMLAASRLLYTESNVAEVMDDEAKRLLCELDSLADECDKTVLDELAIQAAARRRPSANERFDEMIVTFAEWESRCAAAADETRLGRVLAGCFAGAKIPSLVAALKLAYVDYRPLRMMGDLIFRLMRSLV